MGEIEEKENPWNEWRESNFDDGQLDNLERDGVNIQCVNSSEFVVGRQTNFNGPVTIINCATGIPRDFEKGKPEENLQIDGELKNEKIIIRDKVLSQSAAKTIQEVAEKNDSANNQVIPEKKLHSPFYWLKKDFLKIPMSVWIIALSLMAGIVIAFPLIFIKPLPKGEKSSLDLKCFTTSDKDKEVCIFQKYEWGGRNISKEEVKISQNPVDTVIVSQTDSNYCFDLNFCLLMVEELQSDYNDSVCNFFVGGQGNVFPDLGWNASVPSINGSIKICLMGRFQELDFPTYPQMQGVKNLIQFGVDNNFIGKNYSLKAEPGPKKMLSLSLYGIIKKWPHFQDVSKNEKIILERNLTIYPKEAWGGEPPTSFILMKLPVPYVLLSHSVTSQCNNLRTCKSVIKNMQDYHFFKQLADIAYNFLVDSNGNVYEGRGWLKRNSAVSFVNGRNIDINFIGDYSKSIKPTKEQLEGVKNLIAYGVEIGKISENYTLVTANATYSTLSPGKNVYEAVKHWPHFDPNPIRNVKDFEDS